MCLGMGKLRGDRTLNDFEGQRKELMGGYLRLQIKALNLARTPHARSSEI